MINVNNIKKLLEASKRSSRPLPSLFAELIYYRFNQQKLSAYEYFDFHLYSNKLSRQQKSEFVGHRKKLKLYQQVCDPGWMSVPADKLGFQILMECFGFEMPKLLAYFNPKHRLLPNGIIALQSQEQLWNFLSDTNHFPFFLKPNSDFHGNGILSISNFNPGTNSYELLNGNTVSKEALLNTIMDNKAKGGYLFQETIYSHDQIRDLIGNNTLSTLRIWTLNLNEGPKILSSYLRIPTGKNMKDNLVHGRTGNLLATVDATSGKIMNTFSKAGFHEQQIQLHPDTHKELQGFKLPYWDKVINTVKEATLCLPRLGMQAWDIAICNKGPLVIELNVPGDIDWFQAVLYQGYWNESYKRLLKEFR